MTTDTKHEFASPGWLQAVQAIGEEIMAEAIAAGEVGDDANFSMCEVYTDCPPHISETGRVAWHFRIKGRELMHAHDEADDVNIKIVSDYATVARLGAVEYDLTDPSSMPPELAELAEKARAEGKITMSIQGAPVAPPAFLGAHNRIARITKSL